MRTPSPPPPPPVQDVDPIGPDPEELARQRQSLEQQRRGRASLRIDPSTSIPGTPGGASGGTGLQIPRL